MELLLVCVGAGVLFFVLKGPAKQIRMGQHLTRMTNVFEEIERTRHKMPIGGAGGVDSLPLNRQLEADRVLEQGIAHLKSYPRHEVTRELVKNALLAERMGRPIRAAAIHRLIDALISMEVALNLDDFMKSYG